jgi:hypothetical protein
MLKAVPRKVSDIVSWAFSLLRKRSRGVMSHEAVFLAGNKGPEPSADYSRSLFVFDNVVRDCIGVSREHSGIHAPSPKHFYASVLFTALISRSISLVMLAPHSSWAQKLIEHWDYASAAIIVRTMMELRAAFHYLCVDVTSDEEWECRWILLRLHDCNARLRVLAANPTGSEEVSELEKAAESLRNQLKTNGHFVTLRHQQKLLNGGSAYLYPLEEILERAGLARSTYRFLNTVFSSHVHGLPMSYFRMAEENRGRGLPSPVEESSTTICLSLAAAIMTATRDDMYGIFKGIDR